MKNSLILVFGIILGLLINPIILKAQTSINPDINGDGYIDIFDISHVIENFGSNLNVPPTRPPTPTP